MKGKNVRFSKSLFDWMGVVFLCSMIVLGATGPWARQAESLGRPVFGDGLFDILDNRPIVVVDAGHGGPDGGAVGINDVLEAGLNLQVAKLVEAGLNQAGFKVIMTRESEDALAGSKKADMNARREVMRSEDVRAVVSVHMNKWKDAAVHGSITFYMKGSKEGEKLAVSVINAISKETNQSKRSANPGDYFVLRESIAPAVIVECGFLSNPDDVKLLQDEAYQERIANGIVAGVTEYFLVAEPTVPPAPPMGLGQ